MIESKVFLLNEELPNAFMPRSPNKMKFRIQRNLDRNGRGAAFAKVEEILPTCDEWMPPRTGSLGQGYEVHGWTRTERPFINFQRPPHFVEPLGDATCCLLTSSTDGKCLV